MGSDRPLVPVERIQSAIVMVRGHKVILDSDLAALYGVSTKRLNEQVKRNRDRFPSDFAFQVTREEHAALRSQFATLETGRGVHRKYVPWVFTEHGALMAASVLNSPRAVQVSLYVVRAFLRLREWVAGQAQLAPKLTDLERRVAGHDEQLIAIVQAIRRLMTPPDVPRRRIGFGGGDPR
jgi:hypothetical protein